MRHSIRIFLFALIVCAGCTDTRVYYPPSDSAGGWRTPDSPEEVIENTGMLLSKLEAAHSFQKQHAKNGGLLVLRHGWLAYEGYFGKGHREALCNLASVGKSFTSIAVGILMAERPDVFPDGLDTKIFTPQYLPPEAFPLSDPRKADIRLGQLLSFSAGIRGNNPGSVRGGRVTLDPVGPDGWPAVVDSIALGLKDHMMRETLYSAKTLWCEPGGGYSYATASIHIASIMLRHVTGMELQEYIRQKLAAPLEWGRWTYAYKSVAQVTHTPGGGGIALRATDMLRYGYMLLHGGRWGDQQVVPEAYVRHCRAASPYNPHAPYSLQFDVNADGHMEGVPMDAFWKTGSGDHCLFIVPSLDLVVWYLGGRDGQYSPNDTGVPKHPDAEANEDPRTGWQPAGEPRPAMFETLRRVVAAVER